MKAYPKETVGQAVNRALADVRGTTQNYDMVQKFVKALSSYGVVFPTYISYRAELIRNTINTARLAVRELASGNTHLQIAGGKRAAGMLFTSLVVQQAWSSLTEWMTGLSEDELEFLNALKEPWFEDKNLIYIEADGKELRYFDPEYVVPQTMFLNALDGGYKEIEKGNVLNGVYTPIKLLGEGFMDQNILSKTTSQFLTNTDKYKQPIYNAELDEFGEKAAKVGEHFMENMFTPGFLRSVEKMRKASEGEVGFAGSTATFDDIALSFLGFRVQQRDITSDRFLVDPLKQYFHRNNAIGREFSKKAKAELEKLTEVGTLDADQTKRKAKLEEDQKKVEEGRKKLIDELRATVDAFKALKVPDERIQEALKAGKVPVHMRKAIK